MTKANLATLADAEAICLQSGARLTRLRRQILVLLLQASGPITACTERSATAAGVYRSLDFLVAQGLAHRLESREAFIACADPSHLHVSQFLICRRCGNTVEVEDDRIVSVVGQWSRRLGFEVEAETLDVSDSCSTCRGAPLREVVPC